MKRLLFVTLLAISFGTSIQARHVLLFTVESCRADRFSAGGLLAPTITSWSRTGTVFENAYAVSPWTAPSIVSIMTGLYPATHGVSSRGDMGVPDLAALPRLLSEKGYRVPNLNPIARQPYYVHLGLPSAVPAISGNSEADQFVEWLEKNADLAVGSPFFAWFHSGLLRQPYPPIPDPGGMRLSDALRATTKGTLVPAGAVRFTSEDRKILDKLYNSRIQSLDEAFGRILEVLQRKGVLDDTLIVFVGTHGVELLEHGYVGDPSTSLHASLYEETVRVPLIVSWPRKLRGGKREETRVSQLDILPSILGLLGMTSPGRTHGRNLFQDLAARPLFLETAQAGERTSREEEAVMLRAMLDNRYKYLSSDELYDLRKDPKEVTNLAQKLPQVAGRMRLQLSQWLDRCHADQREESRWPPQKQDTQEAGECPTITQPQPGSRLDFEMFTGALILEWTGNKSTSYYVQFGMGSGPNRFAGGAEVEGNFLVVGPFGSATWAELRNWNPFRIRVTPRQARACWSEWVEFQF